MRPARWLTGYIQFIDTHALGLPLKYVAANMRDAFDDRQAYLDFHVKEFKIIAGRQELKYGGERLVGISDWTNNSRTWDGFLGRIWRQEPGRCVHHIGGGGSSYVAR